MYADPLYRKRRGTPPGAIDECRLLLKLHSLGPASICDSQYFILGDYEDNPRQRYIYGLAFVSTAAVVLVGTYGLLQPHTNRVFRKRAGAPFDRCWMYVHAQSIEDVLL